MAVDLAAGRRLAESVLAKGEAGDREEGLREIIARSRVLEKDAAMRRTFRGILPRREAARLRPQRG